MKKFLLVIIAVAISALSFGCSDGIEKTGEIIGELGDTIRDNADEIEEGIEHAVDVIEDLELDEKAKDVADAINDSGVDEIIVDSAKEIGDELGALFGDDTETVDVADASDVPSTDEYTLDIDGTYTTAEDVALYIHIYDDLPDNFMTKSEARDLGWTGGGLDDYAPGMCIGGDTFGNREGLLPKEKGRTYTECDINTLGEDSRGAERIVFSNDGLIFYTDDHYESFVLLYDEDGKAA